MEEDDRDVIVEALEAAKAALGDYRVMLEEGREPLALADEPLEKIAEALTALGVVK